MLKVNFEEELKARWICCPVCDKKKCERYADDCDVKIYLRNRTKEIKFLIDK